MSSLEAKGKSSSHTSESRSGSPIEAMEATFDINKIFADSDSFSEPDQEDFAEVNRNFTHLTSLVRRQYFNYLKGIIKQNYTEWSNSKTEKSSQNSNQLTNDILEKCAAHFEERAVRYCMVVQLYRKYMLRVISEIRHETSRSKLNSRLKQIHTKSIKTSHELKQVAETGKQIEVICTNRHEKLDVFESSSLQWISLSNNNWPKPVDEINPETKYERDCNLSYERSYNLVKSNIVGPHYPPDATNIDHHSNLDKPKFNGIDVPNRTNEIRENFLQNQNSADMYNVNLPQEEDTIPALTLEEKIEKFQQHLNKQEKQIDATNRPPLPLKRKLSSPRRQKSEIIHRKLSISQPISPVSTSSEEDNGPDKTSTPQTVTVVQDSVGKELEDLFAEEKTKDDEISDIFGDGTYNPEIDLILREIEKSQVPGCEVVDSAPNSNETAKNCSGNKKIKGYSLQPLICDLRQSLWPCELHMWKQRLRDTLSQIAEIDIRYHDRVQRRFSELFGEDSEDEFAPYSPSLELDEVLISSCMKRIAPVIVKYLMRPMKEGRIVNRYLFKKLAKKFAYNIILSNQYPDENFIKDRVEHFFCLRNSVMTIEDTDVDIT